MQYSFACIKDFSLLYKFDYARFDKDTFSHLNQIFNRKSFKILIKYRTLWLLLFVCTVVYVDKCYIGKTIHIHIFTYTKRLKMLVTVHNLMKDINTINSCQAHLSVLYAITHQLYLNVWKLVD